MALNEAEFRVRRPGTEWRDTPVTCTVKLVICTDTEMARAIIEGAASILGALFQEEIRWNYTGLEQGHYRRADGPHGQRGARQKHRSIQAVKEEGPHEEGQSLSRSLLVEWPIAEAT